ncbi:MAG: hypothetical protein JKX73_00750 [Flavobacteriales bacterium]|nr:hypothetical protein [Flavobacteriales bacterium]
MMKRTIKASGVLALLFVMYFSSCVKEEFDMSTLVQNGNWQPEIAIPLVHAKLSVDDLLSPAENSTDGLSAGPDGLMKLIYRDTLFSALAQNFIPGLAPGSSLSGAAIGGPHSVFVPIDSLNMNLEVYNQVLGGSFYFEDPKIHLIVTSSIGVPVDLSITVIDAWSPVNGILPIELWGNTAPPSIALNNPSSPAYPTVWGDNAVTVYSFDQTNSNVKDFLLISPKYIFYAIQATINPSGLTDPSLFVLDTSRFSIEVEVELPLFGTANYVTLGDTSDFELEINDPSSSDLTMTEATFMVNTYNGFPCDAEIQLIFIDTITGEKVDSLFPAGQELFLSAAPIGPAPALRVLSEKHKVTEVFVNRAKLDNIAKANKVIVRGQILTNDNGATSIKLYSDYTIEIKLAVKAKLQIGS